MKKFIRSIMVMMSMLLCVGCFAACGAPSITSIKIGGVPAYMEVGDETTLTLELAPEKASAGDVIWSSSNESVAKVNASGKVTALKTGTTIITAMNKKNTNVKDSVSLRVYGEDEKVKLGDKAYTYDKQPHDIELIEAPEGMELTYLYKNNATNEVSPNKPVAAGTYAVSAIDNASGEVVATATLTIHQKEAKLIINDCHKDFSKNDPTFTATLNGIIGDDQVTYTLSRSQGENVGAYTITAEIIQSDNYNVIVSDGKLTINKLNVSIEANNKTSVYGDPIAPTTYTLFEGNTILDESLKANIYGNLKINTPAGISRLPANTYTISCEELTSSNLNIVNTKPGVYTVTKRIVEVSVASEQYKYAGDTEPALRYAIDGTLEGDDLTGCLYRREGETVGFYEYFLDQTINTNYTLVFNESLTTYNFEIKSNQVQIAFKTFEIDYSPEYAEDSIPSDRYEYDVTINGTAIDYSIGLQGQLQLNSTDSVTLNHTVTKSLHMTESEKEKYYQKWNVSLEKTAIAGYDDLLKYEFTFVAGDKLIKFINLNIIATDSEKIYGETDPSFNYTATGFLDGDKIETVIETLNLKRSTGENVAVYDIVLSGNIELFEAKTYYKPNFTAGAFSIEKRELRVTPVSHTVYYGEPAKELSINTDDLNLASRDTLSSILSGSLTRPDNENVGEHIISGDKLKLTSENYYITYTSGTYTILPRPLLIQAVDVSVEYGETISKYPYSYHIVDEFIEKDEEGEDIRVIRDFVLGEPTFSGDLALAETGTKLYAGNSYEIKKGNLKTSPNFSVNYIPGYLTVTKRQVVVSFVAQECSFEDYESTEQTPVYNFTPELAPQDKSRIVHVGTTSPQDSSIISILKDGEGKYVVEFEFTTAEGRIITDCYDVTINSNFDELFYITDGSIKVTVSSVADGATTVTKTYGQKYNIEEIFTVSSSNPDYTIELLPNAYYIKGVTDTETHITKDSYLIDAGTYTVTFFPELVKVRNLSGEDVTSNFSVIPNNEKQASLVINKATLSCIDEPTIQKILYGTSTPTFNGGTYSFTNENGDTIILSGTNEEYSTVDTSSFDVSKVAHLISATFIPTNKNFRNYIHNNVALYVDRQVIDTTVLTWTYGASMENNGELTGSTYTIQATQEGVSHTSYNGDYTETNTYNILENLPNKQFLKQSLSIDYLYMGVAYHEDTDTPDGDDGFLYYIDGETVKKVYPRNKTSFYATYDISTFTLKIYYTDGINNYLLTNKSTLAADKQPEYINTIYAPINAGVYFVKATLCTHNGNYTVFEDNNDETVTEYISYHNLFLVEKYIVNVFDFTSKIIYDNDLIFHYTTNPSDIYGTVTKFFSKEGENNYRELAEPPVDVGEYAVTFIIDTPNYYYYNEYIDFDIIPVTIEVTWGEADTFNFINTTANQTRAFIVKANGEVVFETGKSMTIPEWLIIEYSGLQENGDNYPTGGGKTIEVPSWAGVYTIDITTKATADGSRNYIGESHNTYTIAPIFYNGNITINRGSITYDVAYNNGSDGAISLYNEIYSKMIKVPETENADDYYIKLVYAGLTIDPTGIDTAFVSRLNMAGGPYKIEMLISSKDGNMKETRSSGNLFVNKRTVPLMSGYAEGAIEIAYTGTFVYNELKALDGSEIYTPQPDFYDAATKTYEYRHNGNKDIYFGITYNYYQVMSTNNKEGIPTTAPKVPDETQSFIYLVKAVITAGANYIQPAQAEYYGYFYVVKTTVAMTAANISVEYTGEAIPAPEVLVTNKDLKEVLVKYTNNANIEGIYVERTVVSNGISAPEIKAVGEYVVTFTIMERENFFEIGSVFTTTCIINITPKKITDIDKFVIEPNPFVTEDIANTTRGLRIDNTKARNTNPDYISGTTLRIELLITNANDGSGTIYHKADWRTLPAGNYYYFVAPLNVGNMSNYSQSDYVPFVLTRQLFALTINANVSGGVTINYTPGTNQPYSYTNVTVKKNGVSQTGFDQDDFEILYRSQATPEAEFTNIAPTLNGVYDVKIRLLSANGLYESNYGETTLTIAAPMLDIKGTLSMVYGQADTTLAFELSATGANYEDTITSSFDASGKVSYSSTTANGFWFILKPDFGVADASLLPTTYEVTRDDGQAFNIMPDVNALLTANGGTIASLTSLNSLELGMNYINIFYVSKDCNFAVSYSEFLIMVTALELSHELVSGVENNKGTSNGSDVPLTFAKDTSLAEYQITITKNITLQAESTYSSGWTYKEITINDDSTTFNITLSLPAGDNRNPLPASMSLKATLSTTLTATQINNFFTGAVGVKNIPIELTATLTSLDNRFNIANAIRFVLKVSFEKAQTTAFESRTKTHTEALEYAYGGFFLDEYWGHDRVPDTILENPDYVNKSSHIYLYNLIKFPEYGDGVEGDALISAFREAWSTSGETFTLYEISVYASDNAGNKTGSLVASNTKYNKDDEERNSAGDHLYDFYFYDIDPKTNAGLYYLEVKLLESKYFTETTIVVYLRIKPTTFYAKTKMSIFDKVVQSSEAADYNESIQIYKTESNNVADNPAEETPFNVRYYSDKEKTTLAYASRVTYNRHSPVYTPVSGGTFSTYSEMVTYSRDNGVKEYFVEIIPDDTNSIYVEDITIIILGSVIDLGIFNIYDVLDVNAMASEMDGDQPKYKDLSTLASIGTLTWPEFLQSVFDKSGNSLTEDVISVIRLLDEGSTVIEPVDNAYNFNIQPDADNQVKIRDLMMPLLLEDGSQVAIKVKLAVNLKLVAKASSASFTYNGNPQAPTITAYFQGWNYYVKLSTGADSGALDMDSVVIKELIDTSKPYSTPPKSVAYRNLGTGQITSYAPTNAGSYEVTTTYEVSYVGKTEKVIYECYSEFIINKAKTTVSMEDKDVLYDGTSHRLEATTAITGLNVVITYYNYLDSEEPSPRTAGVYRAFASIDDINYFGYAEASLTIRTTSITIVVTPPDNLVYSGTVISPTYAVYNENNVDITTSLRNEGKLTVLYNNSPYGSTQAGSYNFTVSVEQGNTLAGEASCHYIIQKATPTISFTAPEDTTYTGNEITPTVNIVPSSCSADLIVTYNGSTTAPKNAGTYQVHAKYAPSGASNYNIIEATYTYVILPQEFEISYDRAPHTTTIQLTYKAGLTAAAVRASYTTAALVKFLYEGFAYNDDGTLSDELYSSETFPTDAGIYTIKAYATQANYTGTTLTTLIINRAVPTISFSGASNLVYSGSGKSPLAATNPNTLVYETVYVGTDFSGNDYNSTEKPINAGIYKMITSYAGDKNYCAVSNYQSFEIKKLNLATVAFDLDTLNQVYTGSPLTPTAKALLSGTANVDLTDEIVITFGGSTIAPTNAGTYPVLASLYSCNYIAATANATFTIEKSEDYTITLVNDGTLSLGATSAATISIPENYIVLYTGKENLADGTTPAENNYTSFSLPAHAGTYTGTVLSDNYLVKTFNFTIQKTDLSASMVVPNITIPLGSVANLSETLTVGGTNYTVRYSFKKEGETTYLNTAPNTPGNHKIKVTIVNKDYSGEKEVSYFVTYSNEAQNRVVLAKPYYMHTGAAIVVDAKLYLNGIEQSSPTKKYTKNGTVVTNVIDEGEYVVTLSVGASSYEATFTVVPRIILTVPTSAVFDNTAKSITYEFANAEAYLLHNAKVSLVILRDGLVVDSAIDAGSYVATICYEGYAIYSEPFNIAKMQVASLEQSDITMTYGDMSAIPQYVGTYKVRYEVSVNGTVAYKETIPPVGNHRLKLIVDERNYQGQVIVNLSVSKKLFVLDIDDMEIEYTGAQIFLPSTYANLESLSYQYSTTPSNYVTGLPTDVGTYYIIASSSSNNYAVTYRDTTRPYILVTITKATPEFVVSNLEQTYTGEVLVPTATAIFNGTSYLTTISNPNMVEAGSYTITFSMTTNASNFNTSEEYTFVINKAPVSITYQVPSNAVYDGTQKEIIATPSIASVGSVSQNITKDGETAVLCDAGSYVIVLSTEETDNYLPAELTVLFDIKQAKTVVNCLVENYNYTGNAKPVIVTTVPSDTTKVITYGEDVTDPPVDAGKYTATIVITPTDPNYTTETVTFTYNITKVNDTISYTPPENGFFYYDGTKKELTDVTSSSGTHSVKYYIEESSTYTLVASGGAVQEGNYRAEIATRGNSNYYAVTEYVYFSIHKEQILASITSAIYDYDGTAKSVTLEENHDKGNVVAVYYEGKKYSIIGTLLDDYARTTEAPTEPGVYVATLESTDNRYYIAGQTTAELVINRIKTNITINISGVASDAIMIDYTGNPYTVTATATKHDGSIVDISDVAYDSLTITLQGYTDEVVLQEGGNYEITVDANSYVYYGYAKRYISIKPQPATIFAKQTAVEYTGQANSLSFVIVDSNGNDITTIVEHNTSIAYYYANGNAVEGNSPIAVGQYVAHISVANASYLANASYSFSIVKTSPHILYSGSIDYILNTDSTTIVPRFSTTTYAVKLSTGTLSTSDYYVEYMKQSYETDDEGNTVATWTPFTVTGNAITTLGSYMIRISIRDAQKIAKYKPNLEEYNSVSAPNGYHINESGHLYWEFLLTVVPEE